MLPELERRFTRIESQRHALDALVAGLSDAQLNWRPPAPDGAWSIGQIVDHLIRSDTTFGRAVPDTAALPREPIGFRLVAARWRRALILRAFRRNIPLPLPSTDVEPQREALNAAGLAARWEDARRVMHGELAAYETDETRYMHRVIGPLSASAMLEVEEEHTAYHARQIESRRAHPSFPADAPR